MNQKLIGMIMYHTTMMDAISKQAKLVLSSASDNNIDLVTFGNQNRERLMNIMETAQHTIEDEISKLKDQELTLELVEVLKTWYWDLSQWVKRIENIDQQVLEILMNEKEETTKEIASIYSNREQFKGYNLNSVKK